MIKQAQLGLGAIVFQMIQKLLQIRYKAIIKGIGNKDDLPVAGLI